MVCCKHVLHIIKSKPYELWFRFQVIKSSFGYQVNVDKGASFDRILSKVKEKYLFIIV